MLGKYSISGVKVVSPINFIAQVIGVEVCKGFNEASLSIPTLELARCFTIYRFVRRALLLPIDSRLIRPMLVHIEYDVISKSI